MVVHDSVRCNASEIWCLAHFRDHFIIKQLNRLAVRFLLEYVLFRMLHIIINIIVINEPPHDKTNKMACAPSEDSYQHVHPPSLIRIFAVHMKKAWVFSYPLSASQRLWSDWADAQADLSLRWAHMPFCCFCHEAAHLLSLLKLLLLLMFLLLLFCHRFDTW